MKRTRNSSVESSPRVNKKKVKSEYSLTAVVSPNNDSTPTNSTRTGGGISKSLLTPCRRMGLTKSRCKPLNVFPNDNVSDPDNKKPSLKNKPGRVNSPDAKEGDKLVSGNENSNLKQNLSKRSLTKSSSKEITSKGDSDNSFNTGTTPQPIIDLFVRESKFSQDSVISSDGESIIENVDIGNLKDIKNHKKNINSRKSPCNRKSLVAATKSKLLNTNVEIVCNNINHKVLPKVVLHKINTPENDNTWKVSNNNCDETEENGLHVSSSKSDITVNAVAKPYSRNESKGDENTTSTNKISTECKLVAQNQDKTNRESPKRSATDVCSKTVVVQLKKKSLTAKESDLFQNKEFEKNNRNCISLGNTPKKLNTKDDQTIRNGNIYKNQDTSKKSEKNMEKDKSTNKKRSDSELLKMKCKGERASDVKKAKSAVDVVLKKIESKENISVSSATSSQSSIYSYHSDDDFEEKTIIEKKSYSKKSKLQMNKSKTSLRKEITQTDINEIQERIEQKEEKLRLINGSPRKGLTEAELEELIVAWRGGCQKALEELLEISKARGTMKSDADMEDLLRALHIPHDLVKYDPDEMIFE